MQHIRNVVIGNSKRKAKHGKKHAVAATSAPAKSDPPAFPWIDLLLVIAIIFTLVALRNNSKEKEKTRLKLQEDEKKWLEVQRREREEREKQEEERKQFEEAEKERMRLLEIEHRRLAKIEYQKQRSAKEATKDSLSDFL